MGSENIFGQMDKFIKVFFKMVISMEKGNYFFQILNEYKGFGIMEKENKIKKSKKIIIIRIKLITM